ncbi:MAG: ATP-binding protein [Bacteroidetes bacterium]|nr:MAG: ATP-binding protein [Bacteroidota bacterium]
MAEKHKSWTLHNSYSEIDRINQEFSAFAQANALPQLVIRNIHLALDELINNIISYGYPEDQGHHIDVSVTLSHHLLTIVIEDEGTPFNPLELEQPNTSLSASKRKIGGLGVHLVRNLMDKVYYRWEEGKNILTIEKQISD